MKKVFILLLMLLSLGGCAALPEQVLTQPTRTNNEANTAPVSIAQAEKKFRVQRDIEGKFSFDQTPEQFLQALTREKIALNRESSLEPDGRITEWDGVFWYKTDVIRAHFSPGGEVVALSVISPRYATEKGLKVGDSKSKMIKLYGTNYTQDDYLLWYNYADELNPDFVIGFMVENEKISWWSIYIPSKLSEEP